MLTHTRNSCVNQGLSALLYTLQGCNDRGGQTRVGRPAAGWKDLCIAATPCHPPLWCPSERAHLPAGPSITPVHHLLHSLVCPAVKQFRVGWHGIEEERSVRQLMVLSVNFDINLWWWLHGCQVVLVLVKRKLNRETAQVVLMLGNKRGVLRTNKIIYELRTLRMKNNNSFGVVQ